MIDVKEIRANPERMREAIQLRKIDPTRADLDRWLELDEQKRHLQALLEQLNAEKNRLAQLGKVDSAAARRTGQEIRQQARVLDEQLALVTKEWQNILDWFPNWPDPEMPRGDGEDDNVEECVWIPGVGYVDPDRLGKGAHTAPLMPQHPPHADDPDFRPLHYADLGQKIGGVDTAQGARVSGSRFAYILGHVALMQIALQQLLADKLLGEGLQPIIPPLLVRERSLYGTSHFPEGRDQVYEIKSYNVEEGHPLFLVGSSEPANFSYFMDRTLSESELPIKVFAMTPCFRSEAGSWGKDDPGKNLCGLPACTRPPPLHAAKIIPYIFRIMGQAAELGSVRTLRVLRRRGADRDSPASGRSCGP